MTDIQAALGTAQLEKFDEMQEKREQIINWYNDALAGYSDTLLLQYDTEDVHHAWHLYPIVIKDTEKHSRNTVISALNDAGIGTSVHFIPLHLQPFYKETYNLKKSTYPVTERMYEGEISLPLHPGLTKEDVDYITKRLIDILKL
jgi:dTDP-4-amino-4,6-dideoxygalactose transaminase